MSELKIIPETFLMKIYLGLMLSELLQISPNYHE